MTIYNTANLAGTELVSDNDTSIEVQSVSGFPETPFKLVITDTLENPTLSDIEIVDVNGVDVQNNLFTNLTRGSEGTTQQTWATGAIVDNRGTAGLLDGIVDEIATKSTTEPSDVNSSNWDDYEIQVVTALPTEPDANTLYFVEEG